MQSKLKVAVIVMLATVGTTIFTFGDTAKKLPRPSAGSLELKGSQRGRIALVNKQSRVPAEEIVAVATNLAALTLCRVEVGKAESAQVVVEILDEKEAPILTAYPEDHRAVVNLAGLSQGLSADGIAKFYMSRCRKELLRAFCYACGAGGSQFPNNIMAISKISDLDLARECIPADTIQACLKRLKDYGVTPKQMVPYFAACRQGWAPPPTNEAQKVIWDKIHAMPTTPIKIKPETKKVSE